MDTLFEKPEFASAYSWLIGGRAILGNPAIRWTNFWLPKLWR